MKLYGYWRSSCTYRVRIGLALKGLPYEVVSVHLMRDGGEHRKADFHEKNPMEQVPVLELGPDNSSARLRQSVAILEYLESEHPEPPLLPANPILRARTRELTEIVNAGIQPLQNLTVMQYIKSELGGDARAWCVRAISRGLRAYEEAARPTAGAFSVGDTCTLADCALIPQVYNARRFGIDVEEHMPLIAAIDARCTELDAFIAAHPDQQPDAVKD